MSVLQKEKLAEKILAFVAQRGSCLFAGAGVGKKAGLPSWPEYLAHLSSVAGQYEEETAILMRKRVVENYYLEAAQLYKSCVVIPSGEKYKQLVSPFISNPRYSPNNLRALMALPFSAVVTTNYDRSLHDAYYSLYENQEESGLRLKAPLYVELGDASMKRAIYWTDFYIARVHGRIEIPDSMVLCRDDYRRTEEDPSYQDFLLHVLTRYRCLWVGYSFVDPAITRIFELMCEVLPQPYTQLHLALLPSDCDPKLRGELARYNIEVVEYDPETDHEDLWESIKEAQRQIRTSPREAPDKVESLPGLGRFLASCYSRLKLGVKAEPLVEIVAEGIVAQEIADSGLKGTAKSVLRQSLRKYFGLADSQLDHVVTKAVDGLIEKELCVQDQDVLVCRPDKLKEFDVAMDTLVEGVDNRLKVREGVDADQRLRKSIVDIMHRLFLTRGWDLGAHFAGGCPSSTFEAWEQIESLLGTFAKRISPDLSKAVANAIFDLFRHPEDREAELLADIGRIAFGVELVLNNSRSIAAQLFLIPETLYLDANVLMPAIVEGHPYSPVYADAISRLQDAAAVTGGSIRVFTAKEFLNEIVSHRRLAIRHVREHGLETPDRLRRHILISGADRTNVYIGAYASWVGRRKEDISFMEFLNKVAPYTSEDSLAIFLEKQGVRTITLTFIADEERSRYQQFRTALHAAYEDSIDYTSSKARVLIDHEASQLTRLILDIESGRKPIFVTADKRLMGMCCGSDLGRCANAIISHLGFIQLVDLLLGIKTDRRALARLMWSVGLSDEKTAMRNYLIDLALQHYNEALAMTMWKVVDQISDKAATAAEAEGITMFSGKEHDMARTVAFLDRFEQDFFKNMAEVIRKREKAI